MSVARVDLPCCSDRAFADLMLGVPESTGNEDSIKQDTEADIEILLGKANGCYFRGYYLDGLKRFAQVLRLDQKRISAWVSQVRILVDLGLYDSAIYWADRGCELFRGARMLCFAKAFALAYAGEIEDAKAMINIPVERDEGVMLWLMRGEVLLRVRINLIQKLLTPYKGIGRLGAFFCFVKALSVDQQDPFINQRIGFAYLQSGDYRRAFEHLRASLNVTNDNPLTLYGIAECYRARREYERSLVYVKKAIAGNPNLDCAFELLHRLHQPGRNLLRLFARK
jgi:tetratricopeptide (TPR) repeat protein